MANAFKRNVWILDTTGTFPTGGGDVNVGGFPRVRIRKLIWVATAGGAVGDNCQIADDTGGTVIWEDVVETVTAGNAYRRETSFDGEGFDFIAADSTGLHLTIDSGKLYVYLGGTR